MRPTPIDVPTTDGWRLQASLWLPEAPICGVVLGHAMLANRRAIDRPQGLASLLYERGIAVLNADLRAHGGSGPKPEDGASWTLEDIALRDAPALLGALRARVEPVFAAGHSLFGNALLLGAARGALRVAGIGSLASQLWLPSSFADLPERILRGAFLSSYAALAWPRGYLAARWAQLGSESVPYAFAAQMRDWYLADVWASPDGFDYRAGLGSVELPVLGLYSAADRASPPAAARRFLAPLPRLELHVLEADAGVGHMAMVRSQRARPLWERLAHWLQMQARL